MSNTQLPNGWITAPLKNICDRIVDGSHNPPKGEASGLPMLSARNINKGRVVFDDFRLISEEKFKIENRRTNIQKNDILLTIVGALGRTCVVQESTPIFTLQRSVAVLKQKNMSSSYLKYAIDSPDIQKHIEDNAKGTAQKGIYLKALGEMILPIPPLAEQKEIASLLDNLLAQVDTLKTRLDAIPNILKRFRQSVLAAAVSGKLTEEWRGEPNYTQTDFSLSIPASWQLLTIEDIAAVKGGKRLPKGEELTSDNTGLRYIRAGQLKNGTVNTDGQLYLLPHVQKQISQYIVNTNDVYITIVGACIGDAGIIPEKYDGANLTENAAKICGFKISTESIYLSTWLRSQYIQDLIQSEIKSGAQGKLALKRIRTLPIAFPPIEEQKEIVRRVEELFAFADQIEQRVRVAQQRVNHLTQAILAKAFRGELTAEWREQNPDLISGENSAAALLARIQAEQKLKQVLAKPTRRQPKSLELDTTDFKFDREEANQR